MKQLIWLLFSLPSYEGNLPMVEPVEMAKFYFQGGNLCYKKQNTLQSGCLHFCWQSLLPQAPASPAASLFTPQMAPFNTMQVLLSNMEAILLPE